MAKAGQKTIYKTFDGIVTTSDSAHQKLVVKVAGKHLMVFLPSYKSEITKAEIDLNINDLRIGDSVGMFEAGGSQFPPYTTDHFGKVTATDPLTFVYRVSMTKLSYKPGIFKIRDYATKTIGKSEVTHLQPVPAPNESQSNIAMNSQNVVFTVVNPDKVRFIRFSPFKLAKITSGQRVWIYGRVMGEGKIKSLLTYIVPKK